MNRLSYKTLLTALALSLVAPLAKAADLPANAPNHDPVIHVAPNGDDANPGTAAAPLRTLAGARDAVRKVNRTASGDVVVNLHGGEYPIREAVTFDARDSGCNGHKVIYQAVKDEKPILTGGMAVTGWKLHDKDRNIFRAAVPNGGFRQVTIDDARAVRAREPNRDSNDTFGPYLKFAGANVANKECRLTKPQWDICRVVKNVAEVEMVLISHWYQQRLRIGNPKPTDGGAVFTPVNPSNKLTKPDGFYRGSCFFFENALAFVDRPGEWYHDPREGFLYLCVAEGVDPNTLRVTIPRVATLVALRGTVEDPVKDIEFQRITFECSNWPSPSDHGLNVTQFVQPVGVSAAWEGLDWPPGMIRAKHARRIAFRHNTIRNAGAHGIQFFADVDDADIEGNEIHDIAGNGIEIDSHASRNPPPELQSSGVAIWNNHIRKCGQDYTNGGGLLAHNVRGLIVEHNHIHDMPYSGMQIGNQPGKGFQDLGCVGNRIRFNHIHHCVQLHDDGGGIYTLGGIQEGSVISENYVHDIKASKWAGRYPIDLIYLDNRTSKILVKDNVVNGGRAAERNGSKGNSLQNNTQGSSEIEKNAGIKPGYHARKTTE